MAGLAGPEGAVAQAGLTIAPQGAEQRQACFDAADQISLEARVGRVVRRSGAIVTWVKRRFDAFQASSMPVGSVA